MTAAFRLTGAEGDAHRIEFGTVSAIAGGGTTEFGCADAIDQAAVLAAIGRSASTGRVSLLA